MHPQRGVSYPYDCPNAPPNCAANGYYVRPMSKQIIPLDTDAALGILDQLLGEASKLGAGAAESTISSGVGLSVSVRMGDVDIVEHHRDKQLELTVYDGHRKGSASSSDCREQALADMARAAWSIAKQTNEDAHNGLVDAHLMATELPELDLYHPWDVDAAAAIELATACENTAREHDTKITNSEGAGVNSYAGIRAYGNSHGFRGGFRGTRHSVSCAPIAGDDAGMQRDYWYTTARSESELLDACDVGVIAASRAVRRLGAQQISTRTTPVVFEAQVATGLFRHFVTAISGGNLYRKASFLVDQIDQPVFAQHISIEEQPLLPKALGSAPFDDEGVATRQRSIVDKGILTGYVLSGYSARKLGLPTTGNAGGVRNLVISHGQNDLAGLLKQMDSGLLVTELMGFGVDIVTGNYSRGAAGFWVENGEIQYPVEEITIAGNLRDMFMQIVEVGADIDTRTNIRSGSVLIERMTVAGA